MEIGNYLPKEQSPVSQLKTTEKRAEKLTEKITSVRSESGLRPIRNAERR
jgi:hypothetical protein